MRRRAREGDFVPVGVMIARSRPPLVAVLMAALGLFASSPPAFSWTQPKGGISDHSSPGSHVNLTEQIVMFVLESLGKDHPLSKVALQNLDALNRGQWWADQQGIGISGDFNESIYHLYDSGDPGLNAPSNAEFWYGAATTAYLKHGAELFIDERGEAVCYADYLGRALHFVQDMGCPAHAEGISLALLLHYSPPIRYEPATRTIAPAEPVVPWTEGDSGRAYAERAHSLVAPYVEEYYRRELLSIWPWKGEEYLLEQTPQFLKWAIEVGAGMLIRFHQEVVGAGGEGTEPGGGVATALVVDCSGSMSGEKIARARQAGASYIDAARPSDLACAVAFSTNATLLSGLAPLGSAQNRSALKTRVAALSAGNTTNIGAGLHVAHDELSRCRGETRPVALLLSDGCHNTGELWPSVDEYVNTGWPVFTVAYGRDADRQTLLKIARMTGGAFFAAETSNITQVYQKMLAHSRLGSVLVSYNDNIGQAELLTYVVQVTKDFTSALFSIDWQGSRMELLLNTPSGKKITPQNYSACAGVRYLETATYSFYQVDSPEAGEWKVEVYGADVPTREQVNLTVSGESPVMFNSLMSTPYYRPRESVQIVAKVAEIIGGRATKLGRVEVVAWVKKPTAALLSKAGDGKIVINPWDTIFGSLLSEKKLQLYDDGRHGDCAPGDGIFGATYAETDQEGPYSVEIRCIADTDRGEHVDRLIRESFQVGEIRSNKVTLADLLRVGR